MGLLLDNVALGIGIGAGIGVAIGAGVSSALGRRGGSEDE